MQITDYKYVIWDWNGTLLDDAWLCLEVMNGLLRKRKMAEISEERYREIFSFPVKNYYQALGFDFESEPFEFVSTEFITEYDRRKFECKLQNGARELLNHLQEKNIGQSILSASKHSSLQEIVHFYELVPFFQDIKGIDDHHAHGKTDNARRMMADLDYSPENVLLVGDTVHDYEVADTIGIDCWLVEGGHQDAQRLSTCNTRSISSLTDLL